MAMWTKMRVGLIACAAWPALAVQTVVLHGDDSYPPYSWVEQGRFQGIYVDLLEAAGRQLKDFRLVLKPVPWKRALMELESGRNFGLFAAFKREARTFITQYSVPLHEERTVIVCRVEGGARHKWPDDFRGAQIGINTAFLPGERFDRARQAGLIRVSETKGTQDNLLRLARGQTDCYVGDALGIRWTTKRLQARLAGGPIAGLRLNEPVELSTEPVYVAYGRGGTLNEADRRRFIEQLNQALHIVRQHGEIQRILARYLTTD
jgi:polar amino acid transport system substrate-binding protein